MAGRTGAQGLALALALAAAAVALLAAAYAFAQARALTGLEGVWAGDPAFLEKAGLEVFSVYIAPPGEGGVREGFLQVAAAGGGPEGAAFELRAGAPAPAGALASLGALRRDAVVFPQAELAWEGGGAGPGGLPRRLRLTLSRLEGGLLLDDGRKVWAFLGRDPAASAAAAEAWRIGA
jgi:hypothetical protein